MLVQYFTVDNPDACMGESVPIMKAWVLFI